MTKKEKPTELFNSNTVSLGKAPFLKKGYIINTDNSPLGAYPLLGERRHWHIYTVEDNEIVGLTSLDDETVEKVKEFFKDIRSND